MANKICIRIRQNWGHVCKNLGTTGYIVAHLCGNAIQKSNRQKQNQLTKHSLKYLFGANSQYDLHIHRPPSSVHEESRSQ